MSYEPKTSKVLLAAMFAAALASCESSTGIMPLHFERWYVASAKGPCDTFGGPSECLQVRPVSSGVWQDFFGGIEGFNWQPGYSYEIEVRWLRVPNPPADGSDRVYQLERVISKIPQ